MNEREKNYLADILNFIYSPAQSPPVFATVVTGCGVAEAAETGAVGRGGGGRSRRSRVCTGMACTRVVCTHMACTRVVCTRMACTREWSVSVFWPVPFLTAAAEISADLPQS